MFLADEVETHSGPAARRRKSDEGAIVVHSREAVKLILCAIRVTPHGGPQREARVTRALARDSIRLFQPQDRSGEKYHDLQGVLAVDSYLSKSRPTL